LTDAVLEACGERIRAASHAKTPLAIRGGGTKDFYGEASVGGLGHDLLDVSAYAGIVDYDPTELVVTARAGTRLQEIVTTLRASGQMLACEPPAFGANATLGGAVAAGLSGPRRPYGERCATSCSGCGCSTGGPGSFVRRSRDEERRGLRSVPACHRLAGDARRADGNLAQVRSAAKGRSDAGCSNARRPTR
jgi:hypothetical protein